MCDVHALHQQVVVAHDGAVFGRCAAVDGDVLAYGVVIANFGCGLFAAELEVLRYGADDRAREYYVMVSQTCAAQQRHAVHQAVVVADDKRRGLFERCGGKRRRLLPAGAAAAEKQITQVAASEREPLFYAFLEKGLDKYPMGVYSEDTPRGYLEGGCRMEERNCPMCSQPLDIKQMNLWFEVCDICKKYKDYCYNRELSVLRKSLFFSEKGGAGDGSCISQKDEISQ